MGCRISKNFACQGLPAAETFTLNTTSFNEFFASSEAITKLSEDEVKEAANAAFSLWNAAGASITLTLKFRSWGVGDDDGDSIVLMNLIDSAAFSGAFADSYIDSRSNVSCYIYIFKALRSSKSRDPVYINWSISATPPDDGLILKDIMAHELGHCLGLGHPRAHHGTSIMSTWWFGETIGALSSTDIEALKFLYPPS